MTKQEVINELANISKFVQDEYASLSVSEFYKNEEGILPIPCKGYEKATIKEWFAKIDEELNELKTEIILFSGDIFSRVTADDIRKDIVENHSREIYISEEAADTITAITSFLEAMGIDFEQRQTAQKQVNEKNWRRGRFEE